MKEHHRCNNTKGQLETSFQWIYVLIAGVAFFIIFFLVFKSCVQSSGDTKSAQSLRATAMSIQSAAVQRNINYYLTVPAANVICPADALTMANEKFREDFSATPIFLPPTIGGRLHIITKDLTPTTEDSILVGSVAYGLDDDTQYYFLDTPLTVTFNRLEKYFENATTIHLIDRSKLENYVGSLSKTTKTVVFVSATPLSADELEKVSQASVEPTIIVVTEPTQLVEYFKINTTGNPKKTYSIGKTYYATNEFLIGAIISADPKIFNCTKRSIAQRIMKVTSIYEQRSKVLGQHPQVQQKNMLCAAIHNNATITFHNINAKTDPDAYLGALLHTRDLYQYQQAAKEMDCPVIA